MRVGKGLEPLKTTETDSPLCTVAFHPAHPEPLRQASRDTP